jgi:transcriptional regulator with XRE-family HTH domain
VVYLGKTARRVREKQGLMQKEAAALLGITTVHLCNIENNKAIPSASLIDKYRQLWGVDIYVLAWCELGKSSDLPAAIRTAADKLARLWLRQLDRSKEGKRRDRTA